MNDIPDELMVRYRKEIPKKIEELKGLVKGYTENRKALHTFFHKLRGNAGLYGYPSVSDICKEWEDKLAEASDIENVPQKIKEGFDEQR